MQTMSRAIISSRAMRLIALPLKADTRDRLHALRLPPILVPGKGHLQNLPAENVKNTRSFIEVRLLRYSAGGACLGHQFRQHLGFRSQPAWRGVKRLPAAVFKISRCDSGSWRDSLDEERSRSIRERPPQAYLPAKMTLAHSGTPPKLRPKAPGLSRRGGSGPCPVSIF